MEFASSYLMVMKKETLLTGRVSEHHDLQGWEAQLRRDIAIASGLDSGASSLPTMLQSVAPSVKLKLTAKQKSLTELLHSL